MTIYRERLRAPLSWWLAALAFAAIWGWVFLVVTDWPTAVVVTGLVGGAGLYAVWRYGSLLITVDADAFRVGRASIERGHCGPATALDRQEYRHCLGVGADARAYLVTRPYLDHGVVVSINDPADPTPYWLISSRHPRALAAALEASTDSSHAPIGDQPRG